MVLFLEVAGTSYLSSTPKGAEGHCTNHMYIMTHHETKQISIPTHSDGLDRQSSLSLELNASFRFILSTITIREEKGVKGQP